MLTILWYTGAIVGAIGLISMVCGAIGIMICIYPGAKGINGTSRHKMQSEFKPTLTPTDGYISTEPTYQCGECKECFYRSGINCIFADNYLCDNCINKLAKSG